MEMIRKERALNLPNILTLLRIALLPVIVWRFCMGDLRGALGVYVLAMMTDAADGWIARHLNQMTSLGKLLDPLADKLSLFTLLALFVRAGQIPMTLVQLILLKEAILIVGSIAALSRGIVVYALPVGKLTTLVFVASMILRFLAYRWMADILLWVSVLLSLAALLWYGIVLLKNFRLSAAKANREGCIP